MSIKFLDEFSSKFQRDRFDLKNNQFFAYYALKNLHWTIDGVFFGFGDLRDEDINNIRGTLKENEVFEGWNEHHLIADFKQTDLPLIRITNYKVTYPHREDAQRKIAQRERDLAPLRDAGIIKE